MQSREPCLGKIWRLFGLMVAVTTLGCGGSQAPPPVVTQPHANVSLTVACADAPLARELGFRVAGWAGRTGATVRVEASSPSADITILRPAEFGGPASRGELRAFPASLRVSSNPLQWDRILEEYRNTLPRWGAEVQGLPIAGDGYAVVYRADRFADPMHQEGFRKKWQRPLAPPTTWEDLADVAAYFAEVDRRPSLPPLASDPTRLMVEYHQIVACYDRRARADTPAQPVSKNTVESVALHYQTITGKSRLDTPAFTEAAKWLAQVRTYRIPGTGDVVDALGKADGPVVAVLSLSEIGRLPRDGSGAVESRFRLSALPGTRTYFDPTGKPAAADRQGNYVPYLGSRSAIGVVSQKCQHPDSAWDLLADLATLSTSLTLLGDPQAGVGPYRTEQLDEAREQAWLGYKFDPERTRDLARVMRQYVAQNVVNPALPLRTPDEAQLMAALEKEIRKAALGEVPPDQAVKAAAAEWAKIEASGSPEERARWRRNAAGLP